MEGLEIAGGEFISETESDNESLDEPGDEEAGSECLQE